MTEPLWTPQQVADYFGVPLATLYAWRSKNTAPRAVRVGKHLRFRREDVEKFLEAHSDDRQVSA